MILSISTTFILLAGSFGSQQLLNWGFFGHRMINRQAVFALPPEMYPFFRINIREISELGVRPDQRRYAVPWEGQRHYVDFEAYEGVLQKWRSSADYTDSIDANYRREHGDLPRQVMIHSKMLTKAMFEKRAQDVIRLAAEIGHYIGDAHVPLHTTENYDGQLTSQEGIHGLWETRLPELHYEQYNLFEIRLRYLDDPYAEIWRVLDESHSLVDSVLRIEKEMSERFSGQIMSHETRGNQTSRQFSQAYSNVYEKNLNGMVERRMRDAISLTASFWYTCWVDAGMPDLSSEELVLNDSLEQADGKVEITRRTRIHR